MIYNIKESLSVLNNKKDEAMSIVKQIELKRHEYEAFLFGLGNELSAVRKEINQLKSNIVSVRLGDLLNELSWLSGVSIDEIRLAIKFNMKFSSIDEFFSLIDEVKDEGKSFLVRNVRFRLWSELSNKNSLAVPFDYFTFLDFDLGSLQIDNSLLMEHFLCEMEPFSNEELSITFSLEKNIDDVLCNFNLGSLKEEDDCSWYPGDLFFYSIVNCSQRKYDLQVDKIRKRVKNNK